MLTRIHVNQHHIKANRLRSAGLPVLTIKDYKQNRKGNTATILDDSGNEIARIVYRPNKPLSCGAHVWIETKMNVIVS